MRRSDNNVIRRVTADNRHWGIEVANASGNVIEHNRLHGGGDGIRVGGGSSNNTVQYNNASSNHVGIYQYRGTGSDNRYIGNELTNAGWAALIIEGNPNPFMIRGNVFTVAVR